MKYLTPKYENTRVEVKDIITASTNKFEIQHDPSEEGKGNIIMKAFDLFR